jgi:hypothetical protein
VGAAFLYPFGRLSCELARQTGAAFASWSFTNWSGGVCLAFLAIENFCGCKSLGWIICKGWRSSRMRKMIAMALSKLISICYHIAIFLIAF